MRKIKLTQGKYALVDDEDFERLSQYKWNAWRNKYKHNITFYAIHTIFRKGKNPSAIRMHRMILGVTDPKIQVDHRNCNGLNNQKKNLRICTDQQNKQNRGKQRNNTSGYKGVFFNKRFKKWTAIIGVDGKLKHLGYFKSPKQASIAYKKAQKIYHGEFAR